MISRRMNKFLLAGLSFLLLFAVCGIFKMNASAEGEVARNANKDKEYSALQDAIDEAEQNNYIELLADITESVIIDKEIDLDLDLCNHTITSEGVTITVSSGSCTIRNGTIASTNTSTGINGRAIEVKNNANLYLSFAKVKSSCTGIFAYDNAYVYVGHNSVVEATGNQPALIAQEKARVHAQNNYKIMNTSDSTSLGAVRLSGSSTSRFNNGTITTNGGSGSAVIVANGSVIVGDGAVITCGGSGAALTAGGINNSTGTITVEGGTISNTGSGPSVSIGTQGSVFNINGGEFSDDVGNGNAFTRPDSKLLVPVTGSNPVMYALGYPEGTVARNVNTGAIYSSLADAVSAASGGDTIQMVADHNMDGMLIIGKNITLDLNGKKVTASVADGYDTGGAIRVSGQSISDRAKVTIKDSASGGTIENTAEQSGYGLQIYSCSDVTIESGIIKGYQCGIDMTNLYTLTISGGEIIGNTYGMRPSGGEININGGKIYGKYRGIIINMGSETTLTVNDGEISTDTGNESYTAIEDTGRGTVTIRGGTLTGGTGVSVRTHKWGETTYSSSAVIEGGVIDGAKRSVASVNELGDVDPAKFIITGGYFSDDRGNGDDFTRPKGKILTEVESGDYAGKYELTSVEYPITYVLPEGAQNWSDNPESYTVDSLPLTLFDPVFEGHIFKGWYLDSGYKKVITEITEDNITADGGNLTLYAKFEEDKPDDEPDVKPDVDPSPEPVPQDIKEAFLATVKAKGDKALKVSWTKVENASGYDVYMAKCGKTPKYRKVKTIKGNKTLAWTKKGLRRKSTYQFYVKAWAKKNGKKAYLKTTPKAHAFTSGGNRSYTNARKVTTAKAEITLKKGKTFKIKAKVAKIKKSKKLMHKSHAVKFRYLSADKKVAIVTGKGKIKAVGKGTCYVYVYAHNGVYGKINVTVK